MAELEHITDEYPIPETTCRVENTINKSRFIATISRARTCEEAGSLIEAIKKRFSDANHNCWAYVAGPPGDSLHAGMSDDGEPRGTAGRPMLNTLLHSDVGEAVIVVTRYFGGVKLGTGGLVRAYTTSAQQALASVPLVVKTITSRVEMVLDYGAIAPIRRLAASCGAVLVEEKYGSGVEFVFEVPKHLAGRFVSEAAAFATLR